MPNFSSPIPGQGLTLAPKSQKWMKPPKFTKLDDAANYIFDTLCQPPKLHQLLVMLKGGMTLEGLARVIIFAGTSEGLWTYDLAMLLGRIVIYQLAGIAKRAGLNPSVTHVDRSGLNNLVKLKQIQMTADPSSLEQKNQMASKPVSKGLMAKVNAV